MQPLCGFVSSVSSRASPQKTDKQYTIKFYWRCRPRNAPRCLREWNSSPCLRIRFLHEADATITFAYFPNEGLASVLNVMSDGKSVEVGLLGTDGFVGTPLVAGYRTSPSRVIMQIAGSAFRITAKELAAAMPECPQLTQGMHRFVQELALQSQQVAACNRLHEVEERLARWLLMCQDRIGGDVVPLTQEFLAHMLATRRASVTVAAGILQKAGLITYSRGVVKIQDRSKLEEACCECYGMIVRQTKKWQDEAR